MDRKALLKASQALAHRAKGTAVEAEAEEVCRLTSAGLYHAASGLPKTFTSDNPEVDIGDALEERIRRLNNRARRERQPPVAAATVDPTE